MVPVISLKTVKKHQKLDVKAASTAAVFQNDPATRIWKQVRKGVKNSHGGGRKSDNS